MLVHHHPAYLEVHIVQGLAGYKLIIINFAVVNAVISMQICLTNTNKVRMVIRNNKFNINCLAGNFSCVAKNELAVVSVTTSLVVQDKYAQSTFNFACSTFLHLHNHFLIQFFSSCSLIIL